MVQSERDATDSKKVSPWVKGFVLFHLLAITVWSVPRPRPELIAGTVEPVGNERLLLANNRYLQQSPIKYYLQCTGLWQYWDMFAPDPLKRDIYMDAIVTYRSGDKHTYKYLRVADLPVFDRYFVERYRKYFERINENGLENLWVGTAFRIAQKANTYPGNPPTQIELVRHWREVAAPGQPQPTEYQSGVFFSFPVDERALAGVEMEQR